MACIHSFVCLAVFSFVFSHKPNNLSDLSILFSRWLCKSLLSHFLQRKNSQTFTQKESETKEG